MKQGLRFLLSPSSFFGQLQWSSHHWFILLTFLGLAVLETSVGKNVSSYHQYAHWMTLQTGVGYTTAVWFVTAAKLFLLVSGAFLVSNLIWFVGALFGKKTSQRVLFRRLAVVFTVALAGYMLSHFSGAYPILSFVSIALFIWGLLLGYFAIREQFALNHLETVVVGIFTFLVVVSTWHFVHHTMDNIVRDRSGVAKQLQAPAKGVQNF